MANLTTVHVVVFDVSGSMASPLNLRANARNADGTSGDLNSKRAQTVFDVICRLAEDGIAEAKGHDMYAAVLCFGLREVNTCDLLALLEEQAKLLELVDDKALESTSEIPYNEAVALLRSHGIYQSHEYLQKVNYPTRAGSEQLYTVVGRKPLVELLSRSGAPYCEKYVEENITPQAAGKYFTAFAVPSRRGDLAAIVSRLPQACRGGDWSSGVESGLSSAATSFLTRRISGLSPRTEAAEVRKATDFADGLLDPGGLKGRVRLDLTRFSYASPRSLANVVQLIKRLQSLLAARRGARALSPGQSQALFVDWGSLLDEIEPHLYGGTPMCEALQSVRPIVENRAYSSKVVVLISDGEATDGDPLPPAGKYRRRVSANSSSKATIRPSSTSSRPRHGTSVRNPTRGRHDRSDTPRRLHSTE